MLGSQDEEFKEEEEEEEVVSYLDVQLHLVDVVLDAVVSLLERRRPIGHPCQSVPVELLLLRELVVDADLLGGGQGESERTSKPVGIEEVRRFRPTRPVQV